MCGISGYLGSSNKDREELLSRLNEALRHRGPDDGGVWFSPNKSVGLAHRRLAIIDMSPHGKQPMHSASGRFVTVFNGEIYNFQELRHELIGLGHKFVGSSDTEVMLAAFDQWGISEAIKKLNGMFAVAVMDQQEQRLYLFRDRLGVKPLYYQWQGGSIYFSSELTLPFSNIGERIIDRNGLALYFRYNYIPAPHTIYKGIYKLMPGVLAVVTQDSAARECFSSAEAYWNAERRINDLLSIRNDSMSMDEAVEMVESALDRSIKQRMISDVPLGAFLSGGIDSSLVVAHMQKLSRTRVQTFTIGFSDRLCNESEYAALIARHLGTEHTEMIVTEADALEVIPMLPAMYGEPFADSSQIPTYLVSKLTRQAITVALSGDGGDELFAGYSSYQKLLQAQGFLSLIPSSLYALTAQALRSGAVRQLLRSTYGEQRYEWIINILRLFARNREDWIPQGIHAEHSLPDRLVLGSQPGATLMSYRRCRGNITEQVMCNDSLVYLPDDILTKVDRASMSVSLEVRAPFTDDFELFDVAWKIPFRHKANQEGGKIVLKKALAKHVPPHLFERPKMGFGVPLSRWLNGPLKDWVHNCVDPVRIQEEGYLDPVVVKELTSKTVQENDWYAYKLWAVCIFQAWLKDFHHKGRTN